MRKYRVDIKNPRTGLPVVGAKVTIQINPAGPLALFYYIDDVTSPPCPNPYVTVTGLEEFYFPDNYYDITAQSGGTTTTDEDVMLADIIEIKLLCLGAEQNAAESAAEAAASAASIIGDAASASASAAAAATSETNAANSASIASTSATNASNSAATAQAGAASATTSMTNAANSATAAQGSATTASTAATNAGNSATTATNNANAATTSATNAANSATGAAGSATAASNSAGAAASSSAAVGGYPNGAATNVPRGLQSVSLTNGGTGGTNATNSVVTWAGGNMATNPIITFDIVGGVVQNVRTQPGLYLGAAPTYPTPTWPGVGTGFAATLNFGFLVGSGQYYWVQSADNTKLLHYQNVGGVATADATTGPIVTTTGLQSLTNGLLGGRENIFPDTFLTNYARFGKMSEGERPFACGNQGSTGAVEPPRVSSPFPDGMQFRAQNNTYPSVSFNLPNMGLTAGDQIQIGMFLALASGSIPNGVNFMLFSFAELDNTAVGTQGQTLFTSQTGYLCDTTSKPFMSPVITVPAKAYHLTLYWPPQTTADCYVDAVWVHKLSAPSQPSDIPLIPNGRKRVQALEDAAPWLNANNVLLKRVFYATRTLGTQGVRGDLIFSNNSGFAQSLLTSGAPAGGFNALELPIGWTANSAAPSRFYGEVRTVMAAVGKHPVNGRVVARGYIDVDPTTNGGDTYTILLRDPVTGLAKTVMPADLDDRYTCAIYGTRTDGTPCANLFRSQSNATNNDSAYPNTYNATPNGGGGNTGSGAFGVNQILITSPVERWITASSEFAGQVITAGDGLPALIALPKKIYGIVGRENRTYWWQVQQRDPKSVNMSATGLPAGAVADADGLKWVPTAAGTTTATIQPALGNNPQPSATTSMIAVAAAQVLGTKVCLFGPGDSLIGNGGMLAALGVIDGTDANMNLGFIGTQGTTYKNEGYSGCSLGAFFGANLPGSVPNPFYGSGSFSFAAFLANATIAAQLGALGYTEPHYVFIEAGKVDVGTATSDGAAVALAQSYAANVEAIIASIIAATANTKVVVYMAAAGPVPTAEQITYGPLWRVRRNWMILASQQIAQFSGREANRIYLCPVGAAVDPVVGWPRSYGPRGTSIIRDMVTYATYAAMQADLTKGAGTIATCTDTGGYFVKVGGPNLGRWRDSQLDDGFCWRSTDSIHTGNGTIQEAEAIYAFMKNIN